MANISSRLIYRATQVLNKPLDELASLLGFDIPLTPTIDLANIKADGALVRWSLPERLKQRTTLRYEIHLNGTAIDAVPVHESAVTITGLQPGAFYVVRVALVNSLDFSSKSTPIRFCTRPAASGDFYLASADTHDTENNVPHELIPCVRPFRGLKDIVPPTAASPLVSRDAGNATAPKRIANGRRLTGTTENNIIPQSEDVEVREGSESIQQLTKRLDAVRRETEEAERQLKDEEEDERKQKDELLEERDELRAEVSEKERASRNLKREVNTLERQNTAAQNERAKQERILAQKQQERQKLRDDGAKWMQEVDEMKAEVERIRQNRTDLLQNATREKDDLLQKQAEETANLESLEDEVKEKRAEVKKLERSLKNGTPNGVEQTEPNLVQQYQQDAEGERAWQSHRQMLLQQYSMTYQKMESAKRFHAEQMRYLDSIREGRRRAEDGTTFNVAPVNPEKVSSRADVPRNRHPHRYSLPESPQLSHLPGLHTPFNSSMTNVATGAFPPAPFMNMQNGMTITVPTDSIAMSQEDKDRLTGGAMMSPGAGAELIPADLFSGDADKLDRVPPLPGLGVLPGLSGMPMDGPLPGPASPGSVSSRSPSVFASPRASSTEPLSWLA